MPDFTLAQFYDLLPIRESTFALSDGLSREETWGGTIIRGSAGARLWSGEVTLAPMGFAKARAVSALMAQAQDTDSVFSMLDHRAPSPAADPDGSIYGASTATVGSLPGDRRLISLTGFPAGYLLTAGDRIGWNDNNSARCYHEVVETRTADGAGGFANLKIRPERTLATAVGNGLFVVSPALKAALEPGSWVPGVVRSTHVEGAGFAWQQVR